MDVENAAQKFNALHDELTGDFSNKHFNRVKVLVRGKVKDNCKFEPSKDGTISFGCCFGRSITIKAQEVIQLEPVEDYALPE